MKKFVFISLFVCFSVAISSMCNSKTNDNNVKSFKLSELVRHIKKNSGESYVFLEEPTMKAELYSWGKAGEKTIENTEKDKVVHFFSGSGTMQLNDKRIEVSKGSIVYIKSRDRPAYIDIQSPITGIVITSNASPEQDTLSSTEFTVTDIAKERLRNDNAWNPFLKTTTMTFGLYMLPKKAGGDSTLTHKVDELNIIINGTGTFWVDDKPMDVATGDIVFVRSGHGHYFNSLKTDFLDILILWEKKSLEK